MKLSSAAILIMTISSLAHASHPLIDSVAPEFTLLDQYNKPYDIRQDEGKMILLLASDGQGSIQNKAWVDNINQRYNGKVPIIGIADVRKVPRPLKAFAKREFKKSPVSVLLDWNGDVFISYGLAENVANLILIDKKGIVRYLYSGEATPEACGMLFHIIDHLTNDR